MRISRVVVKNFRMLKDVDISFSEVTTFVGPNGVGKSTILKALDWFFNGRPGELDDSDCSYGCSEEDIEVRVTFNNLTEADRQILGKYSNEDSSVFTAWKIRKSNGVEFLSANAKSFPPFNEIRAAGKAAEKKQLYKNLRESSPELELPVANTRDTIEDAMTAWENSHTDSLEETPVELQTNFFGFNSQGVMSGLFDYVLVGADLRAGEETSDTKNSIIARILEKTIDRTVADEELNEIYEMARGQQQRVFEDKFSEQLEAIDKKLNSAVTSYSKGRTVSIRPSELELKTPKTTFGVIIGDRGIETGVERQGHGFQRTLLIAALQVLAESRETNESGVICLAVEEPELYQHPIQARVFAKVLRSLASDMSQGIQVAYATHSPYFLESRHFNQVRRLVRRNDDLRGVDIFSVNLDEIKQRLDGIVSEKSVDSQLEGMASGTLASAIFSNCALLVEGTSESAILYGLGDRDNAGIFESEGLEIVPVGSKTKLALAHSILTGLGIPVYTLFDGDGGFERRARAKGKTQNKIDQERSSHVSTNNKLLKYFGLDVVDFPQQYVGDSVAIFEDNLETLLEESWPGWWSCYNDLEADPNVNVSKNHDLYRLITLTASVNPPEVLVSIMERALQTQV